MLKLKNVSKYYYNKGVVASGFTKVNLELDAGEFVVITGESGSGKSTLLNVISGLDTYEDGEMYINGLETSHYNDADFEEYRKKYIGNIFQHFNLVNSYSVYQNVELVLLLNGFKSKEVKARVLDIIDKVGMSEFKNTKASKLSGGQKQRVAIARALAKETSIIVADEPTGNLDSASSTSVLELLHKVAKDKLVVVVTHNYDQVAKYATRKIKMHDGKILEDKKIKKADNDVEAKSMDYRDMKFFNKMRIGLRNTFNVIPKFLLLLAVFLFLTVALSGEYSSFKKKKFDGDNFGFASYFMNASDERIVIKKSDNSAFTEEDYSKLTSLDNFGYLVKNDLAEDTRVSLSNENFFVSGKIRDVKTDNSPLTHGRLPENENEVAVIAAEYEYDLVNRPLEMLDKQFEIRHEGYMFSESQLKVKIVGIGYFEDNNNYQPPLVLAFESLYDELAKNNNIDSTLTELTINNKKFAQIEYSTQYKVVANKNVPRGQAYVSQDLRQNCKNYRCLKNTIDIKFNNLYFTDSLKLTMSKEYTRENFKSLLGLKDIDQYYGVVFINEDQVKELFDRGYFQTSLFVKNAYKIDDTFKEIEDLNYKPLMVKKTMTSPFMEDVKAFSEIFQVVFIAILTVGLFFISYFIIKLILKSRNIYFSTIRILGSSREVAKNLLDIELMTVVNLAYLLFLTTIYLVKTDVLKVKLLSDLTEFFLLRDYIILYIILMFISFLIANRYARKLFKKSAMNTYREEV